MKNYSWNYPATLMVPSNSVAVVLEQTSQDKGV